MRARLPLLAPVLLLGLAATAAAHPDRAEHGVVQVSAWGDGVPTRLVEGCAFFAEATLEEGWDAGRLLVLAPGTEGDLVVAYEALWRAENGSLRVGPLDVGPGVFIVGVELDGEHGAYGEAFRVLCGEPVCPREGCETLRVSSTAGRPPPVKVALGLALAGVVVAGAWVVRQG